MTINSLRYFQKDHFIKCVLIEIFSNESYYLTYLLIFTWHEWLQLKILSILNLVETILILITCQILLLQCY